MLLNENQNFFTLYKTLLSKSKKNVFLCRRKLFSIRTVWNNRRV